MDISKLNEFEKGLLTYAGEDRVEPANVLFAHAKKQTGSIVTFKTGFPTLDRHLGNLEPGEMTGVSGPPGNGKSLFCQSITMSLAEQEVPSLWFSFEMPWRQFLTRFHQDYLPRFYGPMKLSQRSIPWIETRIWEAKLKFGCTAVFVDHLHFLLDMARVKNVSLEIGAIVRKLKLLAIKHNLIFFLVAHTVKAKQDHEFGLGDIRDSGMIEAECDNVLYIWRNQKQENSSVVKIAKNRKMGFIDKKIPLILTNEYGVLRLREEQKS